MSEQHPLFASLTGFAPLVYDINEFTGSRRFMCILDWRIIWRVCWTGKHWHMRSGLSFCILKALPMSDNSLCSESLGIKQEQCLAAHDPNCIQIGFLGMSWETQFQPIRLSEHYQSLVEVIDGQNDNTISTVLSYASALPWSAAWCQWKITLIIV